MADTHTADPLPGTIWDEDSYFPPEFIDAVAELPEPMGSLMSEQLDEWAA